MNILEIRAAQSAAVERVAAVLGVYLADTLVTKVLTSEELRPVPLSQLDMLGYTSAWQARTLMLSWRRFERDLFVTDSHNVFIHTQVQRIRLAFVESLAEIVEGES